jgi:hypothetical protein
MLGPTRPLPRAGGQVRITHFGGTAETGTIESVQDDGRTLRVRAAAGDVLVFELLAATARFALGGATGGPRLELLDDR